MRKVWLRNWGDSGSIAPLGIGLALLSLAAILMFASMSSIFLLQRRLTTLAEFAALTGVRYSLTAEAFLRESGVSGLSGLRVGSDTVSDGLTRQVTICSAWQAPVPTFFRLLPREICGSGAARSG